ncbi:hypothetical protein AB2L27_16845 [Kineococcus sp. LSe6-4]|uniref:Uncharacterized protein n=1 Tax=Kineococcus halophytocola TaxID=3234027 RepID=A0ABV4H6M1_9ACTN
MTMTEVSSEIENVLSAQAAVVAKFAAGGIPSRSLVAEAWIPDTAEVLMADLVLVADMGPESLRMRWRNRRTVPFTGAGRRRRRMQLLGDFQAELTRAVDRSVREFRGAQGPSGLTVRARQTAQSATPSS